MGKFFVTAFIGALVVLTFGVMQDDSNSAAGFSVTERRVTALPVTVRRVVPVEEKEIVTPTKVELEQKVIGPSTADLESTENLLSGIDLIGEETQVAAGPVARIVEKAVDKARRLKRCCVDCNCTGECNCSFPGECLINSATPANSIISITQCYGTHCETRTYKPRGEASGTWELGKAPGVKGWSKKVYHRASKVTQGAAPAYYAQPQQFFQPTYTRGFRGGCATCR